MIKRQWYRQASLLNDSDSEQWTYNDGEQELSFALKIKCGKTINLEKIRTDTRCSSVKKELVYTSNMRKFFEDYGDFVDIEKCPVCGESSASSSSSVTIWEDSKYHICASCSHSYLYRQPSEKAQNAFYTNDCSDGYYTDDQKVQSRIEQIYAPKVEWMIEQYEKIVGRKPESLLEFGAGAGHLVYSAKEKGLDAAGIEPSRKCYGWCKEKFGIELLPATSDLNGKKFDIVCSFNVIEHFTDPAECVRMKKELMHEDSMLFVETPKFNSLTVEIQKLFSGTVCGSGLLPYLHNHLFTDASLCTFLLMNGLAPQCVWYFGQDVVQTITQVLNDLDIETSILKPNGLMNHIQPYLDQSRVSDLMLFGARAIK